MKTTDSFCVLLWATIFVMVHAKPSCVYFGDTKHVMCTSGNTDYELTQQFDTGHVDVINVTLRSCKITKIMCDAFKNVPSLQHLNLADNKIEVLMPCVLNDVKQLKTLNLTNNKLSEFADNMFQQTPDIEHIDLTGNKLKNIYPQIFSNLSKLKSLNLSNNAIEGKSLSPRIFNGNRQMVSLDLSRNDMSEATEDLLESLHTLQILTLDRCFLKNVPSFATSTNLRTLKQLVMTTNRVNKLVDPTVFINLDNLELLSLSGNAIEEIGSNVFTPLRKVKSILLRNNRLKHISDTLFQNMPKLVSIDISYNVIEHIKIECFRNTPLKNLNIAGNMLSYLPENFYIRLISGGAKLKKLLFSNNPWQCACLREIVEDLKAHNVEYNTAKYDGSVSVCVASDSITCEREDE